MFDNSKWTLLWINMGENHWEQFNTKEEALEEGNLLEGAVIIPPQVAFIKTENGFERRLSIASYVTL